MGTVPRRRKPVSRKPPTTTIPSEQNSRRSPSTSGSLLSLLENFSLLNIRGLKPRSVPSKVPYIGDLLSHSKQLFFALTETWLKDQLDAEVQLDGYEIRRSDCSYTRTKRRGRDRGGAAVYLRNDIAPLSETVLKFSNGAVEVLGIHIKPVNLLLIVLYRHPDDPSGKRSTHNEFQQALLAIKELLDSRQDPCPEVLLCGDFNLPHMDWVNQKLKSGASCDEQKMIELLQEVTSEYFLFQLITQSTHKHGNTLDLMFSNNPAFLHHYTASPTISSDHYIIECTAALKSPAEPQTFREPNSQDGPAALFDELNFHSEEINWSSIESDLSEVNWETEFEGMNPAEMMNFLTESCARISKDHVPKRKISTDRKHSTIPRDRRILMRRRCKVNKQLCSTQSENVKTRLRTEARDIEIKLQRSYKNEKESNETKAVGAIKRNSRYFYTYAKKFSKISAGIGPFIDAAKNVISLPSKMAEMLTTQYCSVFSQRREPLGSASDYFPEEPTPNPNKPIIDDIQFTRTDIEEAINEISPSAAAGPDRFPAILLKTCRKTLSDPLYIIWRCSLDTGDIPQLLKTAFIIPIHKGESKSIPKNYRPVALTSHIIKAFEKVIRKQIVKFMEENQLFNPSQHGFRMGRSCLSQLLSHYENILSLLEKGHDVDVIYLDFAKAFDKVDFSVTLRKLNRLGITGKIGRWIHSFISNRTQTVLVNGTRSEPADVKSGVPQGSVLGPLIFLILIGDIDQNIAHSFLSSFADDTRVGHAVDSPADCINLQNDLEEVYSWTDVNNMELNGGKFEHLHYSHDPANKTQNTYKSNDNKTIETKDTVKDLGVTLSNDCSFDTHIKKVIDAASNQASWILRTFSSREALPMLTLWKSLVQCKLDYCSQLWNPAKKGDIQRLEMVQRSFLRKIKGIRHLNYWEQLKIMRLYSQQRRRERYLIVYLWKILENQAPNPAPHLIKSHPNPRLGRRCDIPPMATRQGHFHRIREASIFVHGQRLFNVIPMHIRNISECRVDTFKASLDKWLAGVPDEPQIQGYTQCRRAPSNSLVDMHQLHSRRDSMVEEPLPGPGCVPMLP